MDIKIYDSKDFPSYLPKLNLLYDDLFTGGKGFRAKLIHLFAGHLKLNHKTELLLSQTVEFIHNASLLHDDLIDRSQLRRGKTAAWYKYTPEYAVLAGDYLLARVMVNLSGYGNIRLVQYTAEIISDLLEGEWLQDSLIKDFSVDLSQLDRVHNLKTASLFKWCLRAPFIAQERYEPQMHTILEEMGTLLGQLFQRADDLLDYDIRNFEGKAVLGDLKSGYLNSFAAFALRDAAQSGSTNGAQVYRQDLAQVQNMDQFYSVVGGKQAFDEKVAAFDKANQFLIDLYKHHLQNLSHYLKDDEKELLKALEPLTEILYWRKTK
jgi:octaprenyl-diphosphate synthase